MIVTNVFGLEIVNVTDAEITFKLPDCSAFVKVPPCGIVLEARKSEKMLGSLGYACMVTPSGAPGSWDSENLRKILGRFPKAVIVGNMVDAMAFPGKVVAAYPFRGLDGEFEEGIMDARKFYSFPRC